MEMYIFVIHKSVYLDVCVCVVSLIQMCVYMRTYKRNIKCV